MLTKVTTDKSKLREGIKVVADVVGSTMGPMGKNVLLQSVVQVEKGRQPDGTVRPTKDGISVAKHFVTLGGFHEDYGVKLVQSASDKVREKVGDGTSQATVLADAMCFETGDANVHEVERGIREAVSDVIDVLSKWKQEVKSLDDIRKVARISANQNPIADAIAELVYAVGKDGVVYADTSLTGKTYTTKYDGYVANWGVLSNAFLTDEKNMSVPNPLIGVFDYVIRDFATELAPVISHWLKAGINVEGGYIRPLVIMCKDMEGMALKSILNAKVNFKIDERAAKTAGLSSNQYELLKHVKYAPIFVVKMPDAPEKQEMIKDMAQVLSGDWTKYVFSSWNGKGMKDFSGQFLSSKTFFATKDRCVIPVDVNLGGKRIEDLKKLVNETPGDEVLQKRLAAASGGVGYVYIGGNSPQEVEYAKDVAEDVQRAAFSALREGFLPGGGYPLACAAKQLIKHSGTVRNDFYLGYRNALEACFAPVMRIAENAGITLSASFDDYNKGIDIRTGEEVDLLESGIADPFDAVRESLLAAMSSVAIPYITTKYILTNES